MVYVRKFLIKVGKSYPGIREALSFINHEELEIVLNARDDHPLYWIIRGIENPDSLAKLVLGNVEIAVKNILYNSNLKSWLIGRIREAVAIPQNTDVDTYDAFSASYKALAEIRAVGYLLQCFFKVTPHSGKGFDMTIQIKDKKIAVEVSAVRMSKNEAMKLLHFHETPHPSEVSICPAGAPKAGELQVDNIIHKFSQKAEEENSQLPCNIPSLIWLDIQFKDWWSLTKEESQPLYVLNGRFRTGGIWLAFYGRKNIPIIAGEALFEGLSRSMRGIQHEHMRYNGYFYKNDVRASGVVITWPRCTVLYENPFASHELPITALQKLFCVRYFNWPNSWIRPFWERKGANKYLLQRIEHNLEMIQKVVNFANLDW